MVQFDSITNHYAAKRKVGTADGLATGSISKKSSGLTEPVEANKRQKTSDFGYKPSVMGVESTQEVKKEGNLKRQLELAKARRKSQVASTDGKKGVFKSVFWGVVDWI